MAGEEIFWIAQGVGVIGLVVGTLAFQKKTRHAMLVWQIPSALLFAVHFLLLGAYTGAAMAAFVVARDLVFEEKDTKPWARHKIWLYAFMGFGSLILISSWEGPASLLPVGGTLLATYALWQRSPAKIRLYMSAAASLWLPYTFVIMSYAGIVSELIRIVSVNVAMYRLDKKHHHSAEGVRRMRRHIHR